MTNEELVIFFKKWGVRQRQIERWAKEEVIEVTNEMLIEEINKGDE